MPAAASVHLILKKHETQRSLKACLNIRLISSFSTAKPNFVQSYYLVSNLFRCIVSLLVLGISMTASG